MRKLACEILPLLVYKGKEDVPHVVHPLSCFALCSDCPALEACALLPATLRLGFAFPASLGRLIVAAAASFSQDARILHATTKLFYRDFKGPVRIDNNLTHWRYQRDLLLLEYLFSRGW